MAVRQMPGNMALARMSVPASSWASERTMASTAAFDEE
jgi:hypothetical protein